ncbi:hypothetical protein M432DRAFT_111713 [Thermoascus aurantiacus ATCC 26904]
MTSRWFCSSPAACVLTRRRPLGLAIGAVQLHAPSMLPRTTLLRPPPPSPLRRAPAHSARVKPPRSPAGRSIRCTASRSDGLPLVVARLLDAFYHVTQHPCARVGSRRPSIQGQPVRNGQLLATVQGSGGPELGTSVNPLLHPNPGPAAGAPLFPLRHLPALVVLPMMTIILRNDDTAVEPVVPRC